jgi:hypothetical protein
LLETPIPADRSPPISADESVDRSGRDDGRESFDAPIRTSSAGLCAGLSAGIGVSKCDRVRDGE